MKLIWQWKGERDWIEFEKWISHSVIFVHGHIQCILSEKNRWLELVLTALTARVCMVSGCVFFFLLPKAADRWKALSATLLVSYCDGHFDSQFAQLSQSLFSDSLGTRPVSPTCHSTRFPPEFPHSSLIFGYFTGFFIDWPKREKTLISKKPQLKCDNI